MKKQTKALTLNRETLRTLDVAGVRGGTIIPIDYNLTQGCATQGCPSSFCIPQEPVDPNQRFRLPQINY